MLDQAILTSRILIGIALVLLNSQYPQVRAETFNLLDAYQSASKSQQSSSLSVLEIFDKTERPTSTSK